MLGQEVPPVEEVLEERQSPFEAVFDVLRRLFGTQTGPGQIGDYVDHPLNFDGSMGLAQILRGLSGFAGELKLAVLDIGIGWFRWRGQKNVTG